VRCESGMRLQDKEKLRRNMSGWHRGHSDCVGLAFVVRNDNAASRPHLDVFSDN